MRFFPEDERDIPLAIKYEASSIWPVIKLRYGVDPTGAAISMALRDAAAANKMVSYSRNRNYYTQRKCHPLLTYCKVVPAVDALAAGGWLIHQKQSPGGRGWQSAMAPTPKFLGELNRLAGPLPLCIPRKTVILRDKDGLTIDTPQTREVDRMARKISEFNEALCATDARTADGLSLGAPVARIFNKSMDRGGRLYGLGSSWQNIPATERPRITIDGEPVVELDYSTLHPSLLYAEVGTVPPRDCYAIGNWPRPLVKKALLVLINAPNFQSALRYLAHCPEMVPLGPADEQDALHIAARVIADIKAIHQPIAKFFHKDTGARLMRVDSDLAVVVMSKLMRKGILALPVHDSFLVQARHADTLEDTMLICAADLGLIQCRLERTT